MKKVVKKGPKKIKPKIKYRSKFLTEFLRINCRLKCCGFFKQLKRDKIVSKIYQISAKNVNKVNSGIR